MKTRVTLVAACALVALVLTSCAAASEAPRAGGSGGSAEATASATFNRATATDAGAALGTELQRTPAGSLGGKLWVMSVTGSDDLAGTNPVISLFALDGKGKRTVVQDVKADDPSAVLSVQATFERPLPSGTVTLVVTTTLRSKGATGTAPALAVPLTEVPQVEKLTLVAP